jgi:adenylate kinase family enzyme
VPKGSKTMKRTVYIISGPAGVGKSTTSEQLVRTLERSAYISGDDISHFPVNGRSKPWLCSETLNLTWENILSITMNLIKYNYDVVIDYVTFPRELDWFVEQLKDLELRIVYVVLLVDQETLIFRDSLRPKEFQMGERSIILLQEFKQSSLDNKHVIDTSKNDMDQ